MKLGDLVRCTCRDLIWNTRRGDKCLGVLAGGEIVLVLDEVATGHKVQILHPVYGSVFVTRDYVELVE